MITPLALIICCVVLLVIVALSNLYIYRLMRQRNEAAMDDLERRMTREVIEMRSQIFANIARDYNREAKQEEIELVNPDVDTVSTITNEVSNSDSEETTNVDRLFLNRLTTYIEANLHNPDLVVHNLCSYMGVTPLVLNKKLKALVDMSAITLIRTIRLRRAATLLKTSRYTIADVTYDVGFSDLRYFRECFKKEFGVLPQEYKDLASKGGDVEVTPTKSFDKF